MARYEVVLPTDSVSEVFTDLVLLLINRIIMAIHESNTIATLRDSLLPKLISGAIRVKGSEDFLEVNRDEA